MNHPATPREIVAIAVIVASMVTAVLALAIGGVLAGWVVLEWAIVNPAAALTVLLVVFAGAAAVALWQERWR